MTSSVSEARSLGQSFWYDNIRRGLMESGELARLIDLGISGLTSNPTIFEKAITGSSDYDGALTTLAEQGKSAAEIYEALTMEDIGQAADLLRPTYDRTGGDDGYASLEVSPHLAHDTEATVAEARRLFAALGRPNVMIKVPGTPEGVPAFRRLIGEGMNVNVTLLFSTGLYTQVRDAYMDGLEELERSGGDVGGVASVASFFVSRVDTAVNALLGEARGEAAEELLGKAAIANAKHAYRDFKEDFGGERFASLRAKGARVQRPLWASTSTKDPQYSDVLYVEALIGPDTVNTMPEATLLAMLEHGHADLTLEQGLADADRLFQSLEDAGISMEQVTDRLLADGVKSFADSYDSLVANIEEKKTLLLGGRKQGPVGAVAGLPDEVGSIVADLDRSEVVPRIWRKDHTVWKPEPAEIVDRLGWLDIVSRMQQEAPLLTEFAEEVKADGISRIVLLGMGGSSLGPEVLRQVFGSADGYPELTVLDSSIPDRVGDVGRSLDIARTLFVMSSKSGSTVEPNALYAHFRSVAEREVEHTGHHFAAITDEGTSLEGLAHDQGFRSVFLNPGDIGGRYSVLSYYGLVPAALMGVDIAAILNRAESMVEACRPGPAAGDNPGAWLGAAMGSLALAGRDKLTLVCSPSIDSFGLWAEQLLAESTGKEGKGIVPVAGEPLLSSSAYGNDRLFVYLRVKDDDNDAADSLISQVEADGHPVLRLEMRDKHDLGAEFFRWEFATAVAGSVLGINPFDQPDVQLAKDLTESVLAEYRDKGGLPPAITEGSLGSLLSQAGAGDFLAIQAFVNQTAEVDGALAGLRERVTNRYKIPTTLGYGPRFLHSTGQLHKGGRNNGLFLQLTVQRGEDLPVPGEPYTLGVLAEAQALGDLRAMKERGRRAVSVQLGRDVAGEIARLANQLG